MLRVLGGLVAVLLPAGTIVYLFLFKMMSFMQSRLGPMEAGPYGSLQLVAEVGKWMQKEDLAPEAADKSIFKIAPLVVLLSTFLLVVVILLEALVGALAVLVGHPVHAPPHLLAHLLLGHFGDVLGAADEVRAPVAVAPVVLHGGAGPEKAGGAERAVGEELRGVGGEEGIRGGLRSSGGAGDLCGAQS